MKDIDLKKMGPLARRMFFKIENTTGRDKCAFCSGSQGKMVKHMATGLNICPQCVEFIDSQMKLPEEAAPMHQVYNPQMLLTGPHFPPP